MTTTKEDVNLDTWLEHEQDYTCTMLVENGDDIYECGRPAMWRIYCRPACNHHEVVYLCNPCWFEAIQPNFMWHCTFGYPGPFCGFEFFTSSSITYSERLR